MSRRFLDQIIENKIYRGGSIAVLIDPEKTTVDQVKFIAQKIERIECISFAFLGGSYIADQSTDRWIETFKLFCSKPLVLFPGDDSQLSDKADALLLLNLISGRNPRYLIEKHIGAAQKIKSLKIETISTSYILIDGHTCSSVQYFTQTTPIPSHLDAVVANTALAGELIGHKLIYLEAGSGALMPVSTQSIKKVRESCVNPIIVGGGIKTTDQILDHFKAGASVVVIGNHIEKNPDFFDALEGLNIGVCN